MDQPDDDKSMPESTLDTAEMKAGTYVTMSESPEEDSVSTPPRSNSRGSNDHISLPPSISLAPTIPPQNEVQDASSKENT